MSKVQLTMDGAANTTRLTVDEKDVTSSVRSLELSLRTGELPTIRAELAVMAADVRGSAIVRYWFCLDRPWRPAGGPEEPEKNASTVVAVVMSDGAVVALPGASPRVRHARRGSTYAKVAKVTLQASLGPVSDGAELVLYVDDQGRAWARPPAEFVGRFEDAE